MVITDNPVTKQYLFHNLFTIQRMFQGHPNIVVIKRWRIRTHGERVMLGSCGLFDLNTGCTAQKVCGLKIYPVHHIHLASGQGIGARGRINDRQQLNFIKMSSIRLEVV